MAGLQQPIDQRVGFDFVSGAGLGLQNDPSWGPVTGEMHDIPTWVLSQEVLHSQAVGAVLDNLQLDPAPIPAAPRATQSRSCCSSSFRAQRASPTCPARSARASAARRAVWKRAAWRKAMQPVYNFGISHLKPLTTTILGKITGCP